MRAFWGVTALSVLVLHALGTGQAVAATPIFVTLDYQVSPAATGCADGNGFREGVQRQLGYDPFREKAERRVSVRVSRGDSGYEGRIQWADARGRNVGERRLSTRRPGCTDILNNLTFAVAVQIQLLAAVAPPPAPPMSPPSESSSAPTSPVAGSTTSSDRAPSPAEAHPPEEGVPAPSVATPAAPSTAPDASPSSEADRVTLPASPAPPAPTGTWSKLQLTMGLGPSLALALAPRPTATGRLFVDGRVSWFSVELSLDGALPVEQQETTGAAFSLHRFGAEGAACAHAHALAGCVTAGLAYLQASGSGVDAPRAPTGLGTQVGARVVATQQLGSRFFAALRAEGVFLPSRWTVTLNEIAVWSTPRLAALIGVDVGARIF